MPDTRITLRRPLSPAAMVMEERGTFKNFAKNSIHASLARPSTGGAVSDSLSASPTPPVIASFFARGCTFTAKLTPAADSVMGIKFCNPEQSAIELARERESKAPAPLNLDTQRVFLLRIPFSWDLRLSYSHSPMPALVTPASAFMQINVLLVIGTVTGLVLFFKGFGLLQRKRLIQDIPRSTVRSAALGLVEVSGTATGDSTLLSPLCQLDCVFYQITAWLLIGGDRYRHWKKVAEESLAVPFFIADDTGRMLVDAKGAELQIPPDYSEQYGDTGRGSYARAAAYAMEPDVTVPEP